MSDFATLVFFVLGSYGSIVGPVVTYRFVKRLIYSEMEVS